MNPSRPTYHEEFEELIADIRQELSRLKTENQRLRKENDTLRHQLENNSENGNFLEGVSENERLALKQHIKELISRIDSHIGNHKS